MNNNETPALRYDTKALNADVPIREAMKMYAGIAAEGNKMVHCPSPNHTDKKPSAKIYDNTNGCKCFSCQKFFTPIELVKEYNPNLSFPEICQKLIEDFGLNPYHYSNLAEIEAFEQAQREHRFIDYFPLAQSELDFIGVINPSKTEELFSISFEEFAREIDYCETREEVKEAVSFYKCLYAEALKKPEMHGKAKYLDCFICEDKVELCYGKAAEIGLVPEMKDGKGNAIRHNYLHLPSIQEVWQNDRESVEEMLISYAENTADMYLNHIAALNQVVKEWESKPESYHKEAELLRKAVITGTMNKIRSGEISTVKTDEHELVIRTQNEANTLNITTSYSEGCFSGLFNLKPEQQEKIDGLYKYETCKFSEIDIMRERYEIASGIAEKITEHQKEREQALKKEKAQFKGR